MDILCLSSQASTPICLSMDEAASSSCSSSSAIQLGGRAIDRHNPIITDTRRFNANSLPPNPLMKKEEGSSSSSSSSTKSKNSSKKKSFSLVSAKSNDQKKKKSSTKNTSSLKPTDDVDDAETGRKSFGNGKKAVDLVTPPGSTRYLLGDPGSLDGVSDYDPVWPLVPAEENKIQAKKQDNIQSIISKPTADQVVVLRVSLHCKGCAGKVRKHLSRMEGVTSFNVDFTAKKVTVVGDVTPLSVLASVSKVKSAQFWPSETPGAAKK